MKSRKGYIVAGGAGLLLLFVIIISHLLINRRADVHITHENIDTTAISTSYIEYRTASVNQISYLLIDARNVTLHFVDSVAPNISDSEIVLSVAGTFTGERLNYFKSFNICGNHVVKGVAKKGFSSKYCTGYCAAYADTLVIGNSSDTLDSGYKKVQLYKERAVAMGGSFFQQLILVDNGKLAEYIPFNKLNFYRALCVKEGVVSIVQSLDKVSCKDFANAIIEMGYLSALYLDMGNWAWGWLREDNGSIYELSYKYPDTQYQTNWIVLKKVRSE